MDECTKSIKETDGVSFDEIFMTFSQLLPLLFQPVPFIFEPEVDDISQEGKQHQEGNIFISLQFDYLI